MLPDSNACWWAKQKGKEDFKKRKRGEECGLVCCEFQREPGIGMIHHPNRHLIGRKEKSKKVKTGVAIFSMIFFGTFLLKVRRRLKSTKQERNRRRGGGATGKLSRDHIKGVEHHRADAREQSSFLKRNREEEDRSGTRREPR